MSEVGDSRLDVYRQLTDVSLRRVVEPEWGLFMAESATVIDRAVAAGYDAVSALTSPRWLPELSTLLSDSDAAIYVADEAVLAGVTGYRVHRGALAAMRRRPLPALDDVLSRSRRLVVLEAIVDHTNVGAVFRSVAGLGFDGVVVDPTCADPLYRRSVRVSMGTVFAIPWTRAESWPAALDDIHARGFTTVALSPSGASVLSDVAAEVAKKVALVLGTEGHGLSEAAMARVDFRARIPMSSQVDSLNLAAATAIACYALGPAANASPRGEVSRWVGEHQGAGS